MTPFSAQGESTAPLKSEGTAKDGAIALIPSVHGNIGMGTLTRRGTMDKRVGGLNDGGH